jgi:hypothetical protein
VLGGCEGQGPQGDELRKRWQVDGKQLNKERKIADELTSTEISPATTALYGTARTVVGQVPMRQGAERLT